MAPNESKSDTKVDNADSRVTKIEARRMAIGLSKRALSVTAGLDPDYYSHWAAGHWRDPGARRLQAIYDALTDHEEIAQKKKDRQMLIGGPFG